MRARDEYVESTLERVGGNSRFMRSTCVAAKVEESVTPNSRVCQRSDPILATALAVAVRRASLGGLHKYTGQICLTLSPSVSAQESSSLAGIFTFIGSNLCTRP
jgi:hypothetical protein